MDSKSQKLDVKVGKLTTLFLCPFTNSLGFLVDINECQHYDHCSQYCTNTKGSFSCSCADGYRLKDKVTCRANGKSQSIAVMNSSLISVAD